MPDEAVSSGKPVWAVHARPMGAKSEPWRILNVQARSAIQAQAILNRKGYEVAVQTTMKVDAQPDPIHHAQLEPIICGRCGYELSGLTIDRAYVNCPECSYVQGLVTWAPEVTAKRPKLYGVMIFFAFLGMICTALMGLLFMAIYLS